ncbi:MAG: 2,3-bisphosphoglycerate-independent phosphoglycerate mutase [Candidatus Gottesmanbacteria bacterium]
MNKVLLIILDGWGYRQTTTGNAIALAKKPTFDQLWRTYPHAIVPASGLDVGLPEGQMGTSEVNHMVIGSGRIIYQDLVKINKAISDGTFFKNEVLIAAMEHAKKNNSTLHLEGLLGPGGVHSYQTHFYALLTLAKQVGVQNVCIHVFTDGRDTAPTSAKQYIEQLEQKMKEIGIGYIGSIIGRYFAMDRDTNWDRIEKAWQLLIKGVGRQYNSATEAIDDAYKQGETDEFVNASLIGTASTIKENDAVIFVNFRSDRAVELTKKTLDAHIPNLYFVAMTQYRAEFNCPIAFPPETVTNTLGEILGNNKIKELRITETEKFNHLTYFFNCKKLDACEGEDRILLDSYSDIKTHDERPEMRTPDIAKEILEDIEGNKHQLIVTNLCNADMVGHTGNIDAAIKGIEAIDQALSDLIPRALEHDYSIIITADHGNADEMIDEKTGGSITSHSTNPIPLILVSNTYKTITKEAISLADIAPTILDILGIPKPVEMTGISFIS